MKIKWEMSIGIPTAVRSGDIEVDDELLNQWTEKSQQEYIEEIVWDAAIQYVKTSWKAI